MAMLLRDLQALDRMIDTGLIEADTRRIGAEQEMVLVDKTWRPSPHGIDVVNHIRNTLGDDRLTPELARFNAEATGICHRPPAAHASSVDNKGATESLS